MKRGSFRGLFAVIIFVFLTFPCAQAQELKAIKLAEPMKKGGFSAMEAFSKRASVRNWADRELSSLDPMNSIPSGQP